MSRLPLRWRRARTRSPSAPGSWSAASTESPCRLTFLDAQGQPLSEAASGLGFQGEGAYCTRRLVEGEALYGTGERAFDLNLRGRMLELWNRDAESYAPGVDPIHLCIPMLVGQREGRAYGFLFDNPGRARLDLGQARKPGRVALPGRHGRAVRLLFRGAYHPRGAGALHRSSPGGCPCRHAGCWAITRAAGATTRRRRSASWPASFAAAASRATCSTWTSTTWTGTACSPGTASAFPTQRRCWPTCASRASGPSLSSTPASRPSPATTSTTRAWPATPSAGCPMARCSRRRCGPGSVTFPISPIPRCGPGGAISTDRCWRRASPDSGTI